MKKCCKCKLIKTYESFNKASLRKDGLSSSCKDCNKANLKRDYYANKSYYFEKNNKGRAKIREYINLKKTKCSNCNESHISCLDFHHLDPKTKMYNIGQLPNVSWCLKKIDEEIEKCILLCSNCHRKLHWGGVSKT